MTDTFKRWCIQRDELIAENNQLKSRLADLERDGEMLDWAFENPRQFLEAAMLIYGNTKEELFEARVHIDNRMKGQNETNKP